MATALGQQLARLAATQLVLMNRGIAETD